RPWTPPGQGADTAISTQPALALGSGESPLHFLQILRLRQIVEAAQVKQLQEARRGAVSDFTLVRLTALQHRDEAAADELAQQTAAVRAAEIIEFLLRRGLAVGDERQHIDR